MSCIFWQVSEDEVVVSDCGLQDLSIMPFLDALISHKTIAVLDLSHNILGTYFPVTQVIFVLSLHRASLFWQHCRNQLQLNGCFPYYWYLTFATDPLHVVLYALPITQTHDCYSLLRTLFNHSIADYTALILICGIVLNRYFALIACWTDLLFLSFC